MSDIQESYRYIADGTITYHRVFIKPYEKIINEDISFTDKISAMDRAKDICRYSGFVGSVTVTDGNETVYSCQAYNRAYNEFDNKYEQF